MKVRVQFCTSQVRPHTQRMHHGHPLSLLPLRACVLVTRRQVSQALRQRTAAGLLPHLKQAGQHHTHGVAQAHRLCGGGVGITG